MSDYISKSALLELLYKTFEEYNMATDKQDKLGGFGAEVFKRVKEQPTLDEKEIIRKVIERVVERLEELKVNAFNDESVIISDAIEILKEECGISE